MFSAYVELIRIRFLMMLAYRVNYFSGILIYSINIGAYYFLWQAIYDHGDKLGGLTLTQMTTYVAVSWMARAFYFNNLDREIADEIKDGTVAVQLIRPYNYLIVKMAQGLGEGIFRLLLFSAPGMLFVWLLFPIDIPLNGLAWVSFAISLFFSFLINAQINMMTGLAAFFLENNEGLLRAKRVVVDLFSGLILPLSFFPIWAQNVLEWLPFQAITYLPGLIVTGRLTGWDVIQAIMIQIGWFIVLILPIRLFWQKAHKNLVVQGG
jgi:ABC-2 type transport system permease protein